MPNAHLDEPVSVLSLIVGFDIWSKYFSHRWIGVGAGRPQKDKWFILRKKVSRRGPKALTSSHLNKNNTWKWEYIRMMAREKQNKKT